MSSGRLPTLKAGPEFDSAYKEGTVVNGPFFVFRVRPNDLGTVRWGFAVGKKLAPKATQRNRMKRRMRAAAQALAPPPGHDIVVTARKPALGATFGKLSDAFATQLKRATPGEAAT